MSCWKKKKKTKKIKQHQILKRGAMLLEDVIECCDGKSNPIKFFSAHEILIATDNFSESNHISHLSNYYYKWYLGKNEKHPKLLITKDVVWASGFGEENFCRDVAISLMVSGHKNFLRLVGCCLEFKYPAMAYDGVKKHYKLVASEHPWKRRLKIAEDIAIALAYLHTAFARPFVYCMLSTQNCVLDEDGVAKICDFSYCVSIPKGETFVKVDGQMGVYSFLDNAFTTTGVVSEKTDVFTIGMFMGITLLSGEDSFWDITDQHNWLRKFEEEGSMQEIADPKMLEKMGEVSDHELCQMKAFRTLSLRCLDRRGEVPTMVEVAKELKKIQMSLIINDSSSSSV